MDRRAWRATVHGGRKESDTTWSNLACTKGVRQDYYDVTGTAGLNNGRTLTFFMGTLGSRILQLLLLLRFMEQKRSNGEISGNNFGIQAHVMCIKQPIQAYLILFHFDLLYFKFTVFSFFKPIEGLWHACIEQVIFPICVTFWQYFKLFHYCYACYGDLWSVIFDVNITKRLWLTEGSDTA